MIDNPSVISDVLIESNSRSLVHHSQVPEVPAVLLVHYSTAATTSAAIYLCSKHLSRHHRAAACYHCRRRLLYMLVVPLFNHIVRGTRLPMHMHVLFACIIIIHEVYIIDSSPRCLPPMNRYMCSRECMNE